MLFGIKSGFLGGWFHRNGVHAMRSCIFLTWFRITHDHLWPESVDRGERDGHRNGTWTSNFPKNPRRCHRGFINLWVKLSTWSTWILTDLSRRAPKQLVRLFMLGKLHCSLVQRGSPFSSPWCNHTTRAPSIAVPSPRTPSSRHLEAWWPQTAWDQVLTNMNGWRDGWWRMFQTQGNIWKMGKPSILTKNKFRSFLVWDLVFCNETVNGKR
jgi:hypothetical protein